MPPPKGAGIMGFGRVWKAPGRQAPVTKYNRYSTDFIPPAAASITPIPASFSSVAGAALRTTTSVPVPTGTAANDIIVIGLYREDGTTATPPSGFAQKMVVPCSGSHIHNQTIFWKRLTTGASGTFDFTHASIWSEAWCTRITGAATIGDPFNTSFEFATSNSTGSSNITPDVAPVTPTRDNCLVIGSFTNWNGSGWTPPVGFIERVDIAGAITLDTQSQETATSTGIVNATSVNADVGRTGLVMAINPDIQPEGWGVMI